MNRTEFIGTDLYYSQDFVDDKNKEIERLNKERNKTYENGLNYFLELQEKNEEIERLNNIINELEKYINGRIEYCYNNGTYQDVFDVYNEIDMKLQELKGSDKE